jgi:aryl-alcohol dehydrogenase-like predicted oxidoreductase
VITSPIIGANSVEQLQESLDATTVTLSPDDIKELDEASAWKEPL